MGVDPVLTKWRGTLLFDLHTALYWKANKKYAMKQKIKPKYEMKNQSTHEHSKEKEENKSIWPTLQCYSSICRAEGNSCYSLDCPKKTNSKSVPSDKEVFLQELKDIQGILKESMICLQYEPEKTVEGYTYKRAQKALSDIGEIMFFSDFL